MMDERETKTSPGHGPSNGINGTSSNISPRAVSPQHPSHFTVASPSSQTVHAKPCLVHRTGSQDHPDCSPTCGTLNGSCSNDAYHLPCHVVEPASVENGILQQGHETGHIVFIPSNVAAASTSVGVAGEGCSNLLPPPALKSSHHHHQQQPGSHHPYTRPASSWDTYSSRSAGAVTHFAGPSSSAGGAVGDETSAFSVTSPRPRTSISFGYTKNRLSHSRSPPLRRASDGCLLYAGSGTGFQRPVSPLECDPNIFRPIDPCPPHHPHVVRVGRSEQGSGASSSCSVGRVRSLPDDYEEEEDVGVGVSLGMDEEEVDYEGPTLSTDDPRQHLQPRRLMHVGSPPSGGSRTPTSSSSSTVSNSPTTSLSPSGGHNVASTATTHSSGTVIPHRPGGRPNTHSHSSHLRRATRPGGSSSAATNGGDSASLPRQVHYGEGPSGSSPRSSRIQESFSGFPNQRQSHSMTSSLSGRSSGVGDSGSVHRQSSAGVGGRDSDTYSGATSSEHQTYRHRDADPTATVGTQSSSQSHHQQAHNAVITLVVDQRRFRVRLSQLRKKPHTMLGRMFSGSLPPTHYRLPNGDYDLTRCLLEGLSADVFAAVLEYYTQGRMHCPPNVSVPEFKCVCDFFLIPFNHRTVQSWNLRAFLHEVSNDGAKEIFERFLEEELLSEMVKSAKLGERECHIVILLDDDVVDWDADNPPQIPENEINSQILYSTQMYRFLKYVENRDVAKQVLQERGLKKIRIGIEGYPTHKEKVKMRSGHRKEVIYNFAQRPFLRMSWEEEENRSRHVDFQFVKSKSNNDLSTLGEVADAGILPEMLPAPIAFGEELMMMPLVPSTGEGDNGNGDGPSHLAGGNDVGVTIGSPPDGTTLSTEGGAETSAAISHEILSQQQQEIETGGGSEALLEPTPGTESGLQSDNYFQPHHPVLYSPRPDAEEALHPALHPLHRHVHLGMTEETLEPSGV